MNHQALHLLTHSFPTRRSSDLRATSGITVASDARAMESSMNSNAKTTAPGVTTARVQAIDWIVMGRPTSWSGRSSRAAVDDSGGELSPWDGAGDTEIGREHV